MTRSEDKSAHAAAPASPPTDSSAAELAVSSDQVLDEDYVLALLGRPDASPGLIEQLSKSEAAGESRKVRRAIVSHPKTPRYVSLSLLRRLSNFDLMQVALNPVIAGDLKIAAENLLIRLLETISAGERISLARRASGRIAAELLLDPERRVVSAAAENPRLTEALVVKAVLSAKGSKTLVALLCKHPTWSLRQEIRIALLQDQDTPEHYCEDFAKSLPRGTSEAILRTGKLPEKVRTLLVSITKS